MRTSVAPAPRLAVPARFGGGPRRRGRISGHNQNIRRRRTPPTLISHEAIRPILNGPNQEGIKAMDVKAQPGYECVSPVGRALHRVIPIAPRPRSLEGKKIGLVCNGFQGSDLLLEALSDLLHRNDTSLDFIKLPSGKTEPWGTEPQDGTTGELARGAGVGAVIVAAGG